MDVKVSHLQLLSQVAASHSPFPSEEQPHYRQLLKSVTTGGLQDGSKDLVKDP